MDQQGAADAPAVDLKLLRSGDWVIKAQEHLKRAQRDSIGYIRQDMYALTS